MDLDFYKCAICGNIVSKLYDSGVPLSCCGQKMELLKANTKDAAVEKHVPYYMNDNGTEKIQVGEVVHPMITEHYIQFIACTDGNYVLYKKLTPTDQPELVQSIDAKNFTTAFEYCNIHGLWKGEKK